MGIDIQHIELKRTKTHSKKKEKSSISEFLSRDISLFGSKLSDKKKEGFYSDMSILFNAGVDIKTALELIEDEQSKKKDKALFREIKAHILKGGTLSEAIENAGQFSPYEYYSIKIGEESGKLSVVLDDLAKYFSRKISQKRQMVNALSYPVIVFFTAVGAIFFMLRFIVPMFEDVFKRFGGNLPGITKFIIKMSDALAGFGYYFLTIVVLITLLVITQKKSKWYRKAASWTSLKLPVIGGIIRKIYLARFCHSMNLLIGANTPLVGSIKLVEKMIGFYPIESSLHIIGDKIMKGSSLHAALSEYPIYDKRMISLIKVAEEVNQLDIMFAKLAKQYTDDVEHQSGLISSMLEPILIIFIGIFVALILIAMYLPLFNLSTTIG